MLISLALAPTLSLNFLYQNILKLCNKITIIS
nr:MAG TPA: hypothetical protein [Caudoviricetes sp.]